MLWCKERQSNKDILPYLANLLPMHHLHHRVPHQLLQRSRMPAPSHHMTGLEDNSAWFTELLVKAAR